MTITMIGGGRPLRACAVCGGVDDHPRHGFGRTHTEQMTPPSLETVTKALAKTPESERERVYAELTSGRGTYRHLDCCREAGCPDGSCYAAPDLRGGQLLDALMSAPKDEDNG